MTPARMDRLESGVRTVIAFTEAFNRHDVTSMLALVSEECTFEDAYPAPDGARYIGKPALTHYYEEFFTHWPNTHLKIDEAFGFGYRCVALWRRDWTDANGIQLYLRGVDVYRVQDGLIRELLSYIKG